MCNFELEFWTVSFLYDGCGGYICLKLAGFLPRNLVPNCLLLAF